MESKKFLNAEEVAAEFGLDEAALKLFVDAGDVRALADRGTWKYRRDELEALVDAGKIPPPSLSDSDELLVFHDPNQPGNAGHGHGHDDVSYIELDEEALDEQAANAVPSDATDPADPEATEEDWFDPSDAEEMTAGAGEMTESGEQSSSDVAIYSGPDAGSELSDDSPSLATGSDSDVRIASEFEAPRAEDSGILLDFNLDAGATVSSSGSSLRLPQALPDGIDDETAVEADEPVMAETEDSAWDEIPSAAAVGDSSVVGMSAGESGIFLDEESEEGKSSIQLGGDSAIQLGRPDESGILLDDGSNLGMRGGSSVVAGAVSDVDDDSGITVAEDSGITLDAGRGALDEDESGIAFGGDSGIALVGSRVAKGVNDDSGISLSSGDSGISLSSGDSGISLSAGDSGLSLESADDSGIAIDGNAETMADDDFMLNLSEDRTQTLDLSNEFDDDTSFDVNLDDDGDATTEFLLGDEDDVDESSATVIRKGRPQPGSLSAAFDLDDVAEVEDLEISQDLDAGEDDEIEELSDEEEEVFDASEEAFGGDEVEETEDEDYLESAAKSKKAAGPREPAWGADMAIGLVACALFLAANTLILWTGVSTMWDGADAEGPAASLIQTFGDLIK